MRPPLTLSLAQPPLPPPRTALVSVAASDPSVELTCADVQSAGIDAIFGSLGFNVGECMVVDVNLPVVNPGCVSRRRPWTPWHCGRRARCLSRSPCSTLLSSAPPSLGSAGGVDLERTRDDFDDAVIPAVIIAALVLLLGLLLLLCSCCRKSSEEEELLQR